LGPNNEHKFDAVLFQPIGYRDAKSIAELQYMKRSANQKYIMRLEESPREPGFICNEMSKYKLI
jgi:hypothetical protein